MREVLGVKLPVKDRKGRKAHVPKQGTLKPGASKYGKLQSISKAREGKRTVQHKKRCWVPVPRGGKKYSSEDNG